MTMRIHPAFLSLGVLLALNGCISIPAANPKDDPGASIYTLHAAPSKTIAAKKGTGGVIVVPTPEVPAGFDTERIALYFEQGHQLDYYAGAKWSGRLNDVLQQFLVQSARSALPGQVVDTPKLAGTARYRLLVKVTDFQPVYAQGPDQAPRLDVGMTATLTTLPGGAVAANVTIKKSAVASANRLSIVTKELEGLLQTVTGEVFRGLSPHLAQS